MSLPSSGWIPADWLEMAVAMIFKLLGPHVNA